MKILPKSFEVACQDALQRLGADWTLPEVEEQGHIELGKFLGCEVLPPQPEKKSLPAPTAPTAPAKRGRGRPPKAQSGAALPAVPQTTEGNNPSIIVVPSGTKAPVKTLASRCGVKQTDVLAILAALQYHLQHRFTMTKEGINAGRIGEQFGCPPRTTLRTPDGRSWILNFSAYRAMPDDEVKTSQRHGMVVDVYRPIDCE